MWIRLVLATLGVLALSACGGDTPNDGGGDGGAHGMVNVQLEQIDGVLIEGFTLTITVSGEEGEIGTYDWAEDVVGDAQEIEAFYDSVLRQEVPPGEVTVTTVMQPGIEPAQAPCETVVEVAEDEEVTVEVLFHATSGECARILET